MALRHGPCLLTLRKRSRLWKPSARGNISAPPTWSTRPMTECEAKSTSSWAHRILSWQLSRDVNSHGSGVSHGTTASPKPSFWAPLKVGDTVVGGGNAGLTTSKSGHPCSCQKCSQGPPVEKTGRGSLLNRPSCSSDDPIGQET